MSTLKETIRKMVREILEEQEEDLSEGWGETAGEYAKRQHKDKVWQKAVDNIAYADGRRNPTEEDLRQAAKELQLDDRSWRGDK
jgi:hypothetical protein